MTEPSKPATPRHRDDFLVFGAPLIEQDEIDEVVDSMRSGWLGTGPKTRAFEALVREYTGTRYAHALNSCTAALHLSLLAAGVGPGDEVITTPLTFAATGNVILHTGARPVFVDVDRTTQNIDPRLVEAAITPRTKALLVVDMTGRPCELDALMAIGQRHGIPVIEDAAHSMGAVYQGRRVGSIADMTCFSFYITKNVATGEGGMVVTNNATWSEFIERMSLHGLSAGAWQRYQEKDFKHYEVVAPGYKYNMPDLTAAIGLHQMRRLEKMQERRAEVWARYDSALADLPVRLPPPAESGDVHARHLYTVLLDLDRLNATRDEIAQAIREQNIGVGIHFISLHLHAYYRETFGFEADDFPNARFISDRTLSLPLSAALTDDDVEDVIAAVRRVLQAQQKPFPAATSTPRGTS